MTILEVQLAIVKRMRELYPQTRAVYHINTKYCDI